MFKKKTDALISIEETFNPDKLHYILKHFEKLKLQLRKSCITETWNPLAIMKRYLNLSENGKINVNYKQNRSYGRFYAMKQCSLQNLPREVRHTIADEFYIDIDIKNAHPVILLKLCKDEKIDCEDLEEYVINRDKLLKELKLSKGEAKLVYLALMNGGNKLYKTLTYKSTHVKSFKKEMINIRNHFSEKYSEDYKIHSKIKKDENITFNLKGSFLNKILCNEENKILMNMYEFFKKPKDCVLCFDGIMLQKNKKYNLKKCEEYIKKKTNYNLTLAVKPFDQKLKLPSNIEIYKYPKYEYYNDYKKFVNKEISIEKLTNWLNNAIILIDNGGCEYFYTREKNIFYHEDKTYEVNDSWNMRKIKDVYKNLEVIIKVINPYYNLNIENQNTKSKYLFNYLSNENKKNPGFLQRCKERRLMRNYNRVDYIPYFKEKPILEDTFNLFNGFPLQYKKNNYGNMKFEESKIYNHLKKYFFIEQKELDHFLDFVADMIQDPARIKGTGHLFYSNLGCGKGLICKLICKLLGSNNAIVIVNTDRYFEKFNNVYKNKILKIFEEIKEKGSAFHNHNRIKGEITSNEEIVESKGIDQFVCRNFSRIIMNSNNENATFVEPGVRRLSYHHLSDKKANNYDYFKPLWAELKNDQFLKCSFDFFANRKYDSKNVYNSFETEYRLEQKNVNLPLGIKFIIFYFEENYKLLLDETINIQSTLLRSNYKQYCQDEGCKYSFKAFKKQIKKIGIDEPVRVCFNKQRLKCFRLNPAKIESNLRYLLKNKKFKFQYNLKNITVNKNDVFEKINNNFNVEKYENDDIDF